MIGSVVSHYRVEEHLGDGGMGVVYRGLDLHLDRPVALKFLPPNIASRGDAETRFINEAKAASALDHPHIVTVYDIDRTDDDQLFIAMAFYPGETLKNMVERGPLPIGVAVLYAIQVAEGLAEAHEHGIIHRDIKPSNVLVADETKVKIVDFGLARLIEGSTLTDSGAVIGTAYYMSPEQIRGEKVDQRTDLWSLGVLLFQMVTSKLPFEGESTAAVMHAVLSDRPPTLETFNAEYPVALQSVLDGTLEKKREARFSNASEVLAHLRQLYSAMSADKVPTEVLEPPRERRRRRRMVGLLVATVLILMILGAAAILQRFTDMSRFLPWQDTTAGSSEATLFFDQAMDYERRGYLRSHLQNAEQLYRRALELEPDDGHVQAHLSSLLLRLQLSHKNAAQVAEAQALARAALDSSPQDSCAWVAQGRVELQDNAYGAAQAAARKAIEREDRNTRAHVLLGEAQVAVGQVEEGLGILRAAVEMDGGHVWAHPTLARLLFKLGRREEAEVEYQKILEVLPDSPNALNNLGVIHMWDKKEYQEAADLFRHSFRLQPGYMSAMNLGTVYFYMGRMQEAIEAYQLAYEEDPDQPLVQTNLAEAYEEIGDNELAREWYENALATYDREFAGNPPSAVKLSERAVCAAKLERYHEAIANVVEALAASENDPVEPESLVLFHAAKVYALAGRRSETLSYARQAITASYPVEQFRQEPIFDSIRDDPEFLLLLEGAPSSD